MSPNDLPLSAWMDRAASGDDVAFGRLAQGVQDDVLRFCLAHGLRHFDAVEATQEALLRAYRGRLLCARPLQP